MRFIEVESLTKRYGRTVGVEDVTFAIDPGEVFGYLGPNGSGKTTTIRCLMGLIRPTAGKVVVAGRRVRPGWATEHGRIGYLPGDFRMWPRLRARVVLKILAAPDGRDRARTRRYQLAERLDLDLSRRVGDLSKGNRQKVGVVYALQHQPDVLILDEPTVGLDPLIRRVVLDLLREAAEAGAAVLLSSHDLSEVAAVCRRAAILREGRLVELAPVSEIVQQSEHRLKVWFSDQTHRPPIPTDRLPAIRVVDQQPGMLEIAFRGASGPILQWIAQLPVDRIATPQMSLEEAFMQYYRTQRDTASNDSHDAASRRGQR